MSEESINSSADQILSPQTQAEPTSELVDQVVEQPEQFVPSATLAEALERYAIALSPKKVQLLEAYATLLWEWNTKINLTRHTDWDKFVIRDVVDSIQLASVLQQGEAILDVGTGGGVPGVILTILRPDLRVDLCDSTGKKTSALADILDRLKLKNNLWHAKAEELLRVRRYHTLVIRAVSKMDKLLTMLAPCWHSFDRILMIKGPSWVEERGLSRHLGLLNNIALRKIAEYQNPGIDQEDTVDHSSVILQFCQKKRYNEIRQREDDLREGKPIPPIPEELAVDNRPQQEKSDKFAGKSRYRSRGRFSRGKENQPQGTYSLEGRRKPLDSTAKRGKKSIEMKKEGKGWIHPETPFKYSKKAGNKPSSRQNPPSKPQSGTRKTTSRKSNTPPSNS